MSLTVGSAAPSFSKTSQDGTVVAVTAGETRDRVLVLYFYPKDETPGCTAQACSFRDNFSDFADAGAEVVGVSADSADSHRSFAANHRLPFPLLSDADGSLRRAFEVSSTLGIFPGRVTFVIDRKGTIRHVFSSQLRARKHVDEALAIVQRLSAEPL